MRKISVSRNRVLVARVGEVLGRLDVVEERGEGDDRDPQVDGDEQEGEEGSGRLGGAWRGGVMRRLGRAGTKLICDEGVDGGIQRKRRVAMRRVSARREFD